MAAPNDRSLPIVMLNDRKGVAVRTPGTAATSLVTFVENG